MTESGRPSGSIDATDDATDASRCIVCNQPNACALARPGASSSEPCWCVSEVFPKGLVETLSSERGSKRCLCRGCLERERESKRPSKPFA